jgi:hypothetical protein
MGRLGRIGRVAQSCLIGSIGLMSPIHLTAAPFVRWPRRLFFYPRQCRRRVAADIRIRVAQAGA